MGLLNKEALLKKQKLNVEKVILDKNEFVFVREMYGKERDSFERSLLIEETNEQTGTVTYKRALEDFRAKLAVQTLCDESGVNLLTSSDAHQLSSNMGASRLELIVNAAQKLNKITEKDKENLVKNSEGDQEKDSNSDSA